jgi:hypothetical protein
MARLLQLAVFAPPATPNATLIFGPVHGAGYLDAQACHGVYVGHEHRDLPIPSLVAHLVKGGRCDLLDFHRSGAAIAGGLRLSCVAFPRQVS